MMIRRQRCSADVESTLKFTPTPLKLPGNGETFAAARNGISSAAYFSRTSLANPINNDDFPLKAKVSCLKLRGALNERSGMRKSEIMNAKKAQKKYDFGDPDESIGSCIRRGRFRKMGNGCPIWPMPKKDLFEFLSLQLETDLNVELRRHYEMVYLIHEKNAEEVWNVNKKVEDFIREKEGTVWRFEDWGLRTLAYKIRNAKKAHYH